MLASELLGACGASVHAAPSGAAKRPLDSGQPRRRKARRIREPCHETGHCPWDAGPLIRDGGGDEGTSAQVVPGCSFEQVAEARFERPEHSLGHDRLPLTAEAVGRLEERAILDGALGHGCHELRVQDAQVVLEQQARHAAGSQQPAQPVDLPLHHRCRPARKVAIQALSLRACPAFFGARERRHWSFPDASKATGSEEQQLAVYRQVRDAIRERIERELLEVLEGAAPR